MGNGLVFVGANGFVCGLSKDTGAVVWETQLKKGLLKSGSSFVSLMDAEDALYAFSSGQLYKINKRDGSILFEGQKLKKLKNHIATIAIANKSNSNGVASAVSTHKQYSDGGFGDDNGDDD
jgi:outer membrane protein assembly factor BamB